MKNSIVSLIALLAVSGAFAAETEKPVRGTHIIVAPPPGFVPADRFPGYMSEETGASIMVTELPAPFEEVTANLNADALEKQRMTLLKKENASFGTHKGLLFSVAQTARGTDFLKWIAAFGDGKTTYLVTAVFPKESGKELSEVLKKTVLGVRITTEDVDPFDALDFRIEPSGDMKIAKVIGNSVLLSKGGVFPAKDIGTPILVAAASVTKGLEIPVENRKTFTETRMRSISTLKDISPGKLEPITAAGLDGFETVGEATDADSGTKALVYQVILFDKDGFYLIQGIASEQDGKTLLPTFKQIARSFKRTEARPTRP